MDRRSVRRLRGVPFGLSRRRGARTRGEPAGSGRQPGPLHASVVFGNAFHPPLNREGREEREGREDSCLLG